MGKIKENKNGRIKNMKNTGKRKKIGGKTEERGRKETRKEFLITQRCKKVSEAKAQVKMKSLSLL